MDEIVAIFKFIGILFLVIMVFNFMILVHELGHFLAARWRGLVVDRFFIWFGPPIWKKEVNGVVYGLGSIPAGGFVSLPQMAPMESIEGGVEDGVKKEELPPISPLDKIIVAAAGPLFSFLLAVVFAVLAWGIKYPKTQAETTTIAGLVVEGSAAEKAGLKPGDKFVSIGGNPIEKFSGMGESVVWYTVSAPVGPLEIVVERDGQQKKLTAVLEDPKETMPPIEGGVIKRFFAGVFNRPPLPSLGVGPRLTPYVNVLSPNGPAKQAGLEVGDEILEFNGEKAWADSFLGRKWQQGEVAKLKVRRGEKVFDVDVYPRIPEKVEISDPKEKAKFDANPYKIGLGFKASGDYKLGSDKPWIIVSDGAKSIYNTLQKVFSSNSRISGSHLSGPAGIGGLLYDFFKQEDGWKIVIFFGALLNVNLAILNLLPFPVLDGGHIVMAVVEWVRRKPTPVKLLEIVQGAFVMLLFGFMIFITFKDVGDRFVPWVKPKEVYTIEFEPQGAKKPEPKAEG